MDKNEVIVIVKQYAETVKEKINPQKVILYGSFAKGNWHEDSDIDVAVIVDSLDNDLLETKKMLFKLRRGIDDRIEPILLENNSIDGSGFIKDVLKHGQVIYSRQ
ncbi:MAG: nucleotidyltransferase domain-containing protein [Syntrophomonadaceae bacterium]|nr:nucleotidyltransferase domain-containing protein [Syntrophomonadaceae bacterium]